MQGCFTGAQVATAMLWGKAADSRSGGRKMVLLVGLLGTAVSCLGYGFATTFGAGPPAGGRLVALSTGPWASCEFEPTG